jgi:hypothetical protein
VKDLSVENVARDGTSKCLLRRYGPLVAFKIIQNNVILSINTKQDYKMSM